MTKSSWIVGMVMMSLAGVVGASDGASELSHLRLIASLDRPSDGYCFDIPGPGGGPGLEVPLFAHNCKSALTADSAVLFGSGGQLSFPAVSRCVTVAGINSKALPGAALM